MNILNSKTIDKGNSPKDITIIRKIFDSLGIEEYEKNTLNYMSEFINSYIIDILKEAKKNMNLAKREKINIEDVEAAVSTKQKDMYRNRTTIKEMKSLANKINTVELPNIPENDIFLRPPKDINLLGNNFQIYSTELNQLILDNKTMLENTSLRPDEINLLGNKRKVNFANESKNTLNLDHNGKQIKNKRKISLNQAFKKTSQENAKKENNNLIENNTNIKINFSEPKKLVDVKSNNIGLNLDEDNEDDNDNDEGDEEVEGEEYEEENEDNEFNNESESKKDKKNGELNLFHEGDNNDEEDFDD